MRRLTTLRAFTNMKRTVAIMTAASALLTVGLRAAPAPAHPLPFIYENEIELAGNGDFDGDGRQDVVIVDRGQGKFRVG